MYYFLKENVAITEEQIVTLKTSDWSFLKNCPKDFHIIDVATNKGKIYKDFLYYAIEIKDLDLIIKILDKGYFIKTLKKEESLYVFNETYKGWISHIGKFYDKKIMDFLLLEKHKIKISSIVKQIIYSKKITFLNKIKSIRNIHKANNVKINIKETEIILNLIESENLEAIKDLSNLLRNTKYNEIFYYLIEVKNEQIIDYIFSLNVNGNQYYNDLALSSLVENTNRFIKFYEKMNKPKLDGILIAQIIECGNEEIIQYLYNEECLELSYKEHIFKNLIYHSIFKNKISMLKKLLTLWDYDLSDFEEIKKEFSKEINKDLESFVMIYKEKQQLKKKLEKKLIMNNKKEIQKI